MSMVTDKEAGRRTLWYHDGSPYGIKSPNISRTSTFSAAAGPGATEPVPASTAGSAAGPLSSFHSSGAGAGADLEPTSVSVGAGGVAGGVGGVAVCFLDSSAPTCSCGRYFLRMPSLWYFQNCFEASLPATRWRTGRAR